MFEPVFGALYAKAWYEICLLVENANFLSSVGALPAGTDSPKERRVVKNRKMLILTWEEQRDEITAQIMSVPRISRFKVEQDKSGTGIMLHNLRGESAGISETISTLISQMGLSEE